MDNSGHILTRRIIVAKIVAVNTNMAPAVLDAPRSPAHTLGGTVDTKNSTAPSPHPSTEECFACYDGTVYIGHLVEDSEAGEEVEVIEAVPCRHCSRDSR